MEFRYLITKEKFEQVTWDEWCALQSTNEESFQPKELKQLAARMLADEKGNPIPQKQAEKTLGKLSYREMVDAIKQLVASLEGYAVPKDNGNAS